MKLSDSFLKKDDSGVAAGIKLPENASSDTRTIRTWLKQMPRERKKLGTAEKYYSRSLIYTAGF